MNRKIEFDRDQLSWQLSSYTNGNGACVEVAVLPEGGRAIRDSKDRSGPILVFTAAEWSAFASGVRDGEFDH
jgi:predicted secreted Zn-dependent protease